MSQGSSIQQRCAKIGDVAIESGSLLLADGLFSDREDATLDGDLTRHIQDQDGRSFVIAKTGIGDGRYPVFAEFDELGRSGKMIVAIHIFCSPDYTFINHPAFPGAAKSVAAREEEFLRMMNGDDETQIIAKPKTISERTKKMLTIGAIDVMTALNAQRADWQVYLRLQRLVTDEVPDPEQLGSMIGVVSHGQSIEPESLFPAWTNSQLHYRLKKLTSAGVLIRKWTGHGYRLAIRFSRPSKPRRVPQVSIEHFGWLRKPVQLSFTLDEGQPQEPEIAVMLPAAA